MLFMNNFEGRHSQNLNVACVRCWAVSVSAVNDTGAIAEYYAQHLLNMTSIYFESPVDQGTGDNQKIAGSTRKRMISASILLLPSSPAALVTLTESRLDLVRTIEHGLDQIVDIAVEDCSNLRFVSHRKQPDV